MTHHTQFPFKFLSHRITPAEQTPRCALARPKTMGTILLNLHGLCSTDTFNICMFQPFYHLSTTYCVHPLKKQRRKAMYVDHCSLQQQKNRHEVSGKHIICFMRFFFFNFIRYHCYTNLKFKKKITAYHRRYNRMEVLRCATLRKLPQNFSPFASYAFVPCQDFCFTCVC